MASLIGDEGTKDCERVRATGFVKDGRRDLVLVSDSGELGTAVKGQ